MKKGPAKGIKLVRNYGDDIPWVRNYQEIPVIKKLLGVTIKRVVPKVVNDYKMSRPIRNVDRLKKDG